MVAPSALLPVGRAARAAAARVGGHHRPVRMLSDSGRRYVFEPPTAPSAVTDRRVHPAPNLRELTRDVRPLSDLSWLGDLIATAVLLLVCVAVLLALRWLWTHRWHPPERARGRDVRGAARAGGRGTRGRPHGAAGRGRAGQPPQRDRRLLAAAAGDPGRGRGAAEPGGDVRGVRDAGAARAGPRPAAGRGAWPRCSGRPGSPSTRSARTPAERPEPPWRRCTTSSRCGERRGEPAQRDEGADVDRPDRRRRRRSGSLVVGIAAVQGNHPDALLIGLTVAAFAATLWLYLDASARDGGPAWDRSDDDPVRPPGEDSRLAFLTRVVGQHLDAREVGDEAAPAARGAGGAAADGPARRELAGGPRAGAPLLGPELVALAEQRRPTPAWTCGRSTYSSQDRGTVSSSRTSPAPRTGGGLAARRRGPRPGRAGGRRQARRAGDGAGRRSWPAGTC